MRSGGVEVRWQGAVVGAIHQVAGEMFHLCGRWVPAGTAETVVFLAAVAASGSVEVHPVSETGGPLRGEVTEIDGDYIDVLIRPGQPPETA